MADAGNCKDSPNPTSEDKRSRGISVDAAPFTPRNKVTSSVLSPLAPEFYPRNYVASSQLNDAVAVENTVAAALIDEVKQIAATLVHRPEDFDRLASPLIQSLTDSVRDEDTLASVVKELVSESVRNANFRYIGARVCWFLCEHLKFSFGCFEDQLFQRCKSECANFSCGISTQELTEDERTHLINFTFFLAELLFNVKDCTTSRFLHELPHKTAELILKLISIGTPDSLQGAVQILKLAGAVLERHNVDLNSIFSKLQACNQNSELTQVMISSVTAQRAANWGVADSGAIVTAGAGDTADTMHVDASFQPADGSVFYDTNNQIYEINETADDFDSFVGWHTSGSNNIAVDNNMQYWIGDQVMDAETATAFQEFMAGSEPHQNFWCYQP